MNNHKESEFVQHEPCPACGSKDNLARYSDGHGYCFGCKHYENGDGQALEPITKARADLISVELLQKGAPLPPAEPWKSMPSTGVW